MTVKELIEELSKLPQDLTVEAGSGHCEENGEVDGAIVETYEWRKNQPKTFVLILA